MNDEQRPKGDNVALSAGLDDGMRKASPADVCLKKRTFWLDIDPQNVMPVYERLSQVRIELEHRAWVCPFCMQSTEYWVVNDQTIMGCGMASMHANGRSSDCCGSWECQEAQKKFHAMPAESSNDLASAAPLAASAGRRSCAPDDSQR